MHYVSGMEYTCVGLEELVNVGGYRAHGHATRMSHSTRWKWLVLLIVRTFGGEMWVSKGFPTEEMSLWPWPTPPCWSWRSTASCLGDFIAPNSWLVFLDRQPLGRRATPTLQPRCPCDVKRRGGQPRNRGSVLGRGKRLPLSPNCPYHFWSPSNLVPRYQAQFPRG